MNTNHFDYLAAIAATGNLSHASKRLGITQPVLSRYVTSLEKQLGVPLFVRQNKHYYITRAGLIYLNGVRRMKELQTQMYRSIDFLQGSKEAELHIGLSPYRGGREIAAFYPDLLSRYPNLNLRITEGSSKDLLQKLYHQELSVIINLYDAALMPHTKIATFIKTEVLIAVPDYHLLVSEKTTAPGTRTSLTPEQFKTLEDISFVYLDSNTVLGEVVDKACRQYQFNPQALLRTSNSITVSSLLAAGSYGGFVLENTIGKLEHLHFFHFPNPVYLYSGMIFSEDYQPTEIERFLYQLEFGQAKAADPDIVFQNDLGRQLCYDSHLLNERGYK